MLIVEDDAASRNALRFLLAHAGWEVQVASTLSDAIRSLADASLLPDAMVLDLMLPDGDGLDLLRQLRAARSTMRVVVVTGVSDPTWLQRVRELRPAALLSKPIDMPKLLAFLK